MSEPRAPAPAVLTSRARAWPFRVATGSGTGLTLACLATRWTWRAVSPASRRGPRGGPCLSLRLLLGAGCWGAGVLCPRPPCLLPALACPQQRFAERNVSVCSKLCSLEQFQVHSRVERKVRSPHVPPARRRRPLRGGTAVAAANLLPHASPSPLAWCPGACQLPHGQCEREAHSQAGQRGGTGRPAPVGPCWRGLRWVGGRRSSCRWLQDAALTGRRNVRRLSR